MTVGYLENFTHTIVVLRFIWFSCQLSNAFIWNGVQHPNVGTKSLNFLAVNAGGTMAVQVAQLSATALQLNDVRR